MRLPGFVRGPAIPPAVRAGDHDPDDDLIVRFIVITPDEEFYRRLQEIAVTCEWQIGRTATVGETAKLIGFRPTPIIVYESAPDENDWRIAIRQLNELPFRPQVLLASEVADDYLLQEVVRNRGCEILPKSLPAEKLIRRLRFVWFWALASANTASRAERANRLA